MTPLVDTLGTCESVLRPLAEPHDFLADCEAAHVKAGLSFQIAFDYWWTHGHVFKSPDHLLIGGRDRTRDDAWFVWWAAVRPGAFSQSHLAAIRYFLSLMPEPLPYVGWSRLTRASPEPEYYSTKYLLRITRMDT